MLSLSDGIGQPRQVARIEESLCIGCTYCIDACPYDAILGAKKQMHTVLLELCTGCGCCVEPCPLDCVALSDAASGPSVWTQARADAAEKRLLARDRRLRLESEEHEARLAAARAALTSDAQQA